MTEIVNIALNIKNLHGSEHRDSRTSRRSPDMLLHSYYLSSKTKIMSNFNHVYRFP